MSRLPKTRKTSRVRDKWKQKQWIVVQSPKSFRNTPIAYIPITDSEEILGRVVETTLYELMKQDMQDQTKKMLFTVHSINGEKASSMLKGYEYSREYLRSLIRRGSSMISSVGDYVTTDGFKVRVHTLALSQGRIKSSKKHAVRLITSKILQEKSNSLTYDQFSQEAVLGKIASDIYNGTKRITQMRHVGIKKMKLIEEGKAADIEIGENTETTEDEETILEPGVAS